MRHDDTQSAGRSKRVSYIHGEESHARHERRRRTALEAEDRVRQWCSNVGIVFTISADGHHWYFRRGRVCVADWWPASAKLILRRDWEKGIHVHDTEQLLRELKKQHYRERREEREREK